MNKLNLVMIIVGAVFVYMNLLFLMAMAKKKNDIVDIAWGLGFILISLLSLFIIPGYHWRRGLLSVLVSTWGIRLAMYLYYRNKGRAEDFRYAQWKQQWGKHWVIRSYLQVFIIQGFFMLSIAYPLFMFTESRYDGFNWLDLAGLLLWMLGFFFETVGDWQLASFKQRPSNRGKIMDKGLWRLTRHPNYFGESCLWWGIYLIVLSNYHGWLGIFSPLIITILLLKVSGIPLLEKKYQTNAAYRDYVNKTSSFIPWKPKK